jgi:SMODS and SLOG-associating 2TM effector domain 1
MSDADGARHGEPFPDGRVPFRIRIGVTGHRNLEPEEWIVGSVQSRIEQIATTLLPRSDATPVKLAVISSLAEGGDRIAAQAARAYSGEEVRVEVVLPLKEDDFAEVQGFDADSRREFDELVQTASFKRILSGPWSKREPTVGYEAASRYMIRRCDIVIALWDGQAKRGRGGTAPTLLSAAETGKPCIWVPTHPPGQSAQGEAQTDPPLLDNLAPGSAAPFLRQVRERVDGDDPSTTRDGGAQDSGIPDEALRPLRESFARLDAFNRARLDPLPLTARADWPSWCRTPYLRAGLLAAKNKRRFDQLTWSLALLATGAAAALAAGLTVWPTVGAAVVEVVCVTALVLAFGVLKWQGFHQEWLSCRLLTERLRSARYVAQTGLDFRRSTERETIFVEPSADWSVRAFEEVWDSRPNPSAKPQRLTKGELTRVKDVLANGWIQGQIDYHKKAARRHEIDHAGLTLLAVALLIGTIVFPFFHVFSYEQTLAVYCSITLPVAAASIGAIRTIRQHHALAERFRRMEGELIVVRSALLDAATEAKLRGAASDAARAVAGEAGDWFGAMWFLDVDQPA